MFPVAQPWVPKIPPKLPLVGKLSALNQPVIVILVVEERLERET
jgi:hypothetical protein